MKTVNTIKTLHTLKTILCGKRNNFTCGFAWAKDDSTILFGIGGKEIQIGGVANHST